MKNKKGQYSIDRIEIESTDVFDLLKATWRLIELKERHQRTVRDTFLYIKYCHYKICGSHGKQIFLLLACHCVLTRIMPLIFYVVLIHKSKIFIACSDILWCFKYIKCKQENWKLFSSCFFRHFLIPIDFSFCVLIIESTIKIDNWISYLLYNLWLNPHHPHYFYLAIGVIIFSWTNTHLLVCASERCKIFFQL